MVNLSQEIALNIITEVIKLVPYLNVDIKKQVQLRDKIQEQLNEYEITSKCTELAKGDILEKAFMFLACKKLEGMSETTRYNYVLLFKKLDAHFNKPIFSITTIDLRLFLDTVYKDNQPNSLNAKISKIKSFFTWLQDEGYITKNPSKNLLQIKEPYRRRGHVHAMDVEKMREKCNTTRDKAMYEFLLSTGCRVSEVSDSLISNIDWARNSITVIGKGNKERLVFFSTRTRMFLEEYIKERETKGIHSNCLFVASKLPHAKLGTRSIERTIKTIAESANITYDVFPHLLRHTLATKAVEQDVPVHMLQKLMGHSNASITEKYYDISTTNLEQAYKKISL